MRLFLGFSWKGGEEGELRTVVEDSHGMVECLDRQFCLCIFMHCLGESTVWQLDGRNGYWLCGTSKLGLRKESLEVYRDCLPAVFVDGGIAHLERLCQVGI